MENFMFENPTRFYFGRKQLQHLSDELVGAKSVMIVYGDDSAKQSGLYDRIVKLVENVNAKAVGFGGVTGNPTLAKATEGAELANAEGVDFILGVGGGAVMDCSKAIALIARQTNAWKKHWVRCEPIIADPIPCGFVVTCAGSGSEGNGRAAILNERTRVKSGEDYPELRARFAILEPELTFSVSREQTVFGAYETLSHLMEAYFSPAVGTVADDLIEAAMKNVIQSLEAVLEKPDDYNARANLMWTSTLAENQMLKCGKQGIYQCRMIGDEISAFTGCAHGEALAALQAQYYRFVKVTSIYMTLQLKRFAVNIWGVNPEGKTDIEAAIEGIDALAAWTRKIGAYHTLSELGVTEDLVPKIARSTTIIPMKYCKLNSDDIEILLEQCL